MNSPPRQLPLPLPQAPSFAAADLLEDASNAEALAWLDRPAEWPLGRLALWGPAGVGKSHMLHAIATREGWALLAGPGLRGLPEPPATPGLALDDADHVPEEEALLHLINLCAEDRRPLLLAGRAAPARWKVALPDLASRLRATTAVEIQPASDSLLAALLEKQFADRQLRTDPAFRAWLLARLPREAGAVAEVAARLDRAALAAGGRITRPLARLVLADLPGFGTAEGNIEDDFMTEQQPASPPTPGLL